MRLKFHTNKTIYLIETSETKIYKLFANLTGHNWTKSKRKKRNLSLKLSDTIIDPTQTQNESGRKKVLDNKLLCGQFIIMFFLFLIKIPFNSSDH